MIWQLWSTQGLYTQSISGRQITDTTFCGYYNLKVIKCYRGGVQIRGGGVRILSTPYLMIKFKIRSGGDLFRGKLER